MGWKQDKEQAKMGLNDCENRTSQNSRILESGERPSRPIPAVLTLFSPFCLLFARFPRFLVIDGKKGQPNVPSPGRKKRVSSSFLCHFFALFHGTCVIESTISDQSCPNRLLWSCLSPFLLHPCFLIVSGKYVKIRRSNHGRHTHLPFGAHFL